MIRQVFSRSVSRSTSDGLFALAWLIVLYVSILDGYLLCHTRDVIAAMERNPLGNCLISFAGGSVWLFLLLKVIGTTLVGMSLLVIYRSHQRIGLTIVFWLAALQVGLLLFLNYGHNY